jgi:AGCS family alanine or glycine:cation symporter
MLLLLGGTGLFLTTRLCFFQIKYAPYILKETFGKMFTKGKGEGTISPFQAASTALASTVGASNIVGVPTAIMFGGPGAVFWMWTIAIFGMGSKFSEVVLGLKYREKNEEGVYVGGPMYYMKNGLNLKWLGAFFSLFLMIEILASIMVQSNSVAASALETFKLRTSISVIVTLIIVSLVVIGGIKRIGNVAEKLVPIMAGLYILASVIIIVINFKEIPTMFWLIFRNAFTPMSAIGGFTGSTVAASIRWGMARGIYSNEAGMGTAPIAHSTAIIDHPVRQGFWAIFEIIVDTLIICSATAFVVLVSGVWKSPGAFDNPSGLPAMAFINYFGSTGGILITLCLLLFVISTIIVITFYGEKQAEFLFGLKFSKVMRYVYLISIFIGAIGGAKFLWNFLDLSLALIIIPNLITVVMLHNDVVKLKNEFFTSGKYYLKNKTDVR